ncbi:glycosyltransferase, partial [Akkermansiaceae bacterium]|nr:glycosyltransferase [Akkermansiaceae bacterium]
ASLEPSSGGPARSVPQLALAQARQGAEVGLWSPDPSHEGLADLSSGESTKLQIFSGNFSQSLDVFGVPDLVHDHGIWLPCHREVVKICNERSIPRIVSPRGMLEPWALNHKKWKKRLAWWLYQKRDLQSAVALHATAEQEVANLQRLGLKKSAIILPNGVDLPVIEHGSVTTSSREKTALFLGRTHPIKNLPSLVRAWAKVLPSGWSMRVVGPDEDGHLSKLKNLVDQAALSESWSFEASLEGDAKWQAMSDADLFILPSYSENFGIVVAEALASGTPVITTTGTPWQGLQEHDCGWWVNPSIQEIGEALQVATSLDQKELQAMGARGRAWVTEEFAWPAIAAKVEQFYEQLLSARLK